MNKSLVVSGYFLIIWGILMIILDGGLQTLHGILAVAFSICVLILITVKLVRGKREGGEVENAVETE